MIFKKIIIIVCLFVAVKASAQDIVAKGDTLILPNGAKFWKGEKITLGTGTNPDGSFNFIYIPEVLHLIKKRCLKGDFAGRIATIKKFQKDGAYKGGYSYNILVVDFGDPIRYWCDIQGALTSNEIVNTFSETKRNNNNNNNNNNNTKKKAIVF